MKVAQDHKITRVTALPGEGWRRSEAPGMGHRRRQQPRARRGLLKFVGVRAWVVDVAERYGWVWRQRDVDLYGSRGAFSPGPLGLLRALLAQCPCAFFIATENPAM
jgi:hypothetical protein